MARHIHVHLHLPPDDEDEDIEVDAAAVPEEDEEPPKPRRRRKRKARTAPKGPNPAVVANEILDGSRSNALANGGMTLPDVPVLPAAPGIK